MMGSSNNSRLSGFFLMKVMILGLDAASPVLVERYIDKLPNLRMLFERGTHGILKSVIPPMSCPAWQCFATGKNPARIGVFGLAYLSPERKVVHGRTTQELGSFWDLASKSGLRAGIFNVPGTYPPYEVKNGFMVAGFPAPPGKTWAYPAELVAKLNSELDGYEIDVPLSKPSEMRGGEQAYLAQVARLHTKCLEASKLLLKWFELDIFFMTFQAIDLVQHDFVRYMDEPGSPYSTVVEDWYVRVDEAVGELKRLANPSHLLILSDHGSAPIKISLNVNEFLRSKGILAVRPGVKPKKPTREFYAGLRKMIMKTMPMGLITSAYRLFPSSISYKFTVSSQIDNMLTRMVDSIDWKRTKAFSTGGPQAAIYINNEYGVREDGGKASYFDDDPLDREALIQDLKNMLGELRHPISGTKLQAIFHRKEDVFKGPFENEAPDLCVELFGEGGEKIHVNITLDSGKIWNLFPHSSSHHVREGVWALDGEGILANKKYNAGLLDLAPTLLKLLKLEIPNDLDGIVLNEIFTKKQESVPATSDSSSLVQEVRS